jgi:hypothetical protein
MIRLTGFAILAAGALFLTWIIDAQAQVVSPWGYTLEDQNEPEVLALRTQYGTFRVMRTEDWGCGFVEANQNVQIEWHEAHVVLWPQSEDWSPACPAHILAQMDSVPCFMNEWGDCDVWVEHA